MIKNIRHTGIVVNGLEASLHFYCDLLGFEIIKQMKEKSAYIDDVLGLKGVEVTTIKMQTKDGQKIELLKYHSHPNKEIVRQIHDVGPGHIAFTVDDLNDTYEKLKAQGISFNSQPCASPDGYAKVVFCRAPEGTFVELVEVL